MTLLQHATLAHQQHVVTTLGGLAVALAEAGLGSPSVIVVGDVLRGIAAAANPASRFGT